MVVTLDGLSTLYYRRNMSDPGASPADKPSTLWDSLLTQALAMRAAGWSVFPCEPGAKTPFARKLPRLDPEQPHSRANPNTFLSFAEEPASVEQIREWWTAPRRGGEPPNLAVLTGASGVLVVDVDAHKVGPERLAEVIASLPASPLIVSTPSGGRH